MTKNDILEKLTQKKEYIQNTFEVMQKIRKLKIVILIFM